MEPTTSLYVVEQGARLHKVGGRLLVRNAKGSVLQEVPMLRLERVLLLGNVEVSRAAFVHLSRAEIDLVYLTREGRFCCRANPLRLRDASLRLAQYAMASRQDRKLDLARRLVEAKILNYRTLLRKRLPETSEDAARTRTRLKLEAEHALKAEALESLLGIEGTAAREYFAGLRTKLKQDLGFSNRQKRPPRDPVNAMLSFGYTLLFGQLLSAVLAAGLDPYLGVLHEPKIGRPSLALDLMEEQRPLVDAVVLNLVNRFQVRASDFTDAGEDGIRMGEAALGRFVAAYHQRIGESVLHEPTGREVDYREFARLQALSYRNWVRGEGGYVPLRWR